jgi:ribosomal protein S18 acetylase RimI-like enzyme
VRVIEDARAIGYRAMRLDTLRIPKMTTANRLYDALGFRDIAPYYANPLPDVRYMELDLAAPGPAAGDERQRSRPRPAG